MKHKLIALSFSTLITVLSGTATSKTIQPDIVTNVQLSNTDTNRIVCANGQMNDVFFSTDKLQEVPLSGKFGFIKFPILKKGNELSYVVKRSEFHFICDGQAYTLLATPDSIPAQVIYLGDSILSTAKENLELMGAMPREKQGVFLTVSALKNELPDNFRVSTEPVKNWQSNVITGADIALVRTIKVDGIGLRLKEFLVRSHQKQYLDEKRFVNPQISTSIRAVTVDPLAIESGQMARVFIIEEITN